MLKGISGACLLSALTAGVITMSMAPVTADKTAAVTISVNRAVKGDRQPLAPPIALRAHDSISPEKPYLERAVSGCERAFSSLVEPTRADILTHCTT
jgi:hypothetical protein